MGRTGNLALAWIVFSGWLLTTGSAAPGADDLRGSVGHLGENLASDVIRVQQLLNQVPHGVGGPQAQLTEDGLAGSQTINAIKRFQRIQLGFEDSLIEPGKSTWQRLLEYQGFAGQSRGPIPVAWGKQVTAGFKQKVLEISGQLEVDPNHLMAAMAFETAGTFSPAIPNQAGSGATGLIQFMPATARGLGTSINDLRRMSGVDQLDYVKRHFWPHRGKMNTLADVYMAILYPVAVGQPDEYVLFDRDIKPNTYRLNAGLDADHDGRITKREATAMVEARLTRGNRPEFRG